MAVAVKCMWVYAAGEERENFEILLQNTQITDILCSSYTSPWLSPVKRKESFAKQIKAGTKRKESFGMAKVSFVSRIRETRNLKRIFWRNPGPAFWGPTNLRFDQDDPNILTQLGFNGKPLF